LDFGFGVCLSQGLGEGHGLGFFAVDYGDFAEVARDGAQVF
jgi:hypothetical protein